MRWNRPAQTTAAFDGQADNGTRGSTSSASFTCSRNLIPKEIFMLMLNMIAQIAPAIGDKGLAVLGGGLGIGRIGGQAMDGIARQPEAGGRIGTNMIIAAALIEGFTFFALVICKGVAF
jgi:F-type H+-transporting ATPase subunit c